MTRKLNVCLVFGGKSGEHEVSLQSAKSIYEMLDKSKYNVYLVGVDKQGHWLLGDAGNYLLNANNPKLIALNKSAGSAIIPINETENSELIMTKTGEKVGRIDVFFPVIHGTYGEDGSLQGMFEMLDAAYVGPGVLGSALGMDKDIAKKLFKTAGIQTAKHFIFRKYEKEEGIVKTVLNNFSLPVFVKPANLGSSVGINKAHDLKELKAAIKDAFKYDSKIMVEEYIKGREIECSVLGNDQPVASVPGEVIPTHEFYSYDAKYIDENGARLKIPADLPEAVIKEIQEIAVKGFLALECYGMARVDFFLSDDGKIYLNELNTIPGFTKISMYPKLWEHSGIPYRELLDRLIELAIEKKQQKDSLKRSYTP
jgi:D-alanine-D-alanine ligase